MMIVGGSTPCFDPFIPGEHWIEYLKVMEMG